MSIAAELFRTKFLNDCPLLACASLNDFVCFTQTILSLSLTVSPSFASLVVQEKFIVSMLDYISAALSLVFVLYTSLLN